MQAITVGVSMCDRWGTGFSLPNCLHFWPGTVGSSEWLCTEICAEDRGQPLPPVVLLLSHSCARVVLSHLSAVLPCLFPAISFLYPFFFHTALSFLDPFSVLPFRPPWLYPVFSPTQLLTACVFGFLKKTIKEVKELAQSLSVVRNSAKLKDTNSGINPLNTFKKGDPIRSLPQ